MLKTMHGLKIESKPCTVQNTNTFVHCSLVGRAEKGSTILCLSPKSPRQFATPHLQAVKARPRPSIQGTLPCNQHQSNPTPTLPPQAPLHTPTPPLPRPCPFPDKTPSSASPPGYQARAQALHPVHLPAHATPPPAADPPFAPWRQHHGMGGKGCRSTCLALPVERYAGRAANRLHGR